MALPHFRKDQTRTEYRNISDSDHKSVHKSVKVTRSNSYEDCINRVGDKVKGIGRFIRSVEAHDLINMIMHKKKTQNVRKHCLFRPNELAIITEAIKQNTTRVSFSHFIRSSARFLAEQIVQKRIPMPSGVLWFDPLRCLVLSLGEGDATALQSKRQTG
jgi:hypothetical protein